MIAPYANPDLSRAEVDALPGLTVLDFGANWCGHCQGAAAIIAAALTAELGREPLRHLKIEDGKGRALGRSFAVKLWPTLVFLRNGREFARVVRPTRRQDIEDLLGAPQG